VFVVWLSGPLIPVTVTIKLPAADDVTVRVAVPEPPVMLPGLIVAVRPADGLVVRVTVPVNPLTGETVIVEVPAELTITVKVVGLAATVKSGRPVTVNATVAE